MPAFRKKPVVIEAWLWMPQGPVRDRPSWLTMSDLVFDSGDGNNLLIKTLEGTMVSLAGSIVIGLVCGLSFRDLRAVLLAAVILGGAWAAFCWAIGAP